MNKHLTRTMARWPGLIFLALLAALPGVHASAEDGESELVRKLITRVDQLERELKQLKSNSAAATTEAMQEEAQPVYPRVRLNGFVDFTYQDSNVAGTHAHFAVGQFDLFVKAAISEKASLLAETVISAEANNNWAIDIERIIFQYNLSPYFNFGVGRYHTAIGYYNNAFHHGTWFQAATGRPSFLAFEDEGGLLPVHNVGVTVSGEIPSGRLGLRYNAELGNGRSYANPAGEDNQVQNIRDNNSAKSTNFALSARPVGVPGLQFGTGYYHDTLNPEGQAATTENNWNSFVTYLDARWEFIAEYYSIKHQPTGGAATRSSLWFAQIARQIGPLRPFFRYTYTDVPVGDKAFALINGTGLSNTSTWGIRWDFEAYAAIKAQYDSVKTKGQAAEENITLQLALTF